MLRRSSTTENVRRVRKWSHHSIIVRRGAAPGGHHQRTCLPRSRRRRRVIMICIGNGVALLLQTLQVQQCLLIVYASRGDLHTSMKVPRQRSLRRYLIHRVKSGRDSLCFLGRSCQQFLHLSVEIGLEFSQCFAARAPCQPHIFTLKNAFTPLRLSFRLLFWVAQSSRSINLIHILFIYSIIQNSQETNYF